MILISILILICLLLGSLTLYVRKVHEKNGDILCDVEVFDNISDKALREELENLSVANNVNYVPGHVACSGEVYKNGKETKTAISLKYYGNRKAMKKLLGVFIEIRIYQGPSLPLVKRYLIVKFTVPKRHTKRSKNRLYKFRIHDINIGVLGDRLKAEMLVSSLPSGTRSSLGRTETMYVYLHKSSVFEIRRVPVISYKEEEKELQNFHFSEKCMFPEVQITQDKRTNAIIVNFCSRFNPSKMKILHIVARNKRIPIFSKNQCIVRVKNIKSASYTLQMHGHCDGHEYFRSWQVFAANKHKKTKGTYRGKGPIIVMKVKRNHKISNDEPKIDRRRIPEGFC